MSVKTLTLSEIAEINPSLGVSLDETDEVSFVPMGAFSEVTASVVAEETRQFGQVKKGFTGFRSGDVIFAKITPCFENGKIGLANISRDVGFGSTEFHVIRARPEMADPRFLHHFLRLGSVRLSGTKRMTGSAGQRRVPKSFLESLPVPALPLDEQRRIAAMLDKAEELRAKRRAAIALLDQLPQAIFLEMFGDPATNPKGWPLERLGAVARTMSGGTPNRKIDAYYGGTIPWVKSGELHQGTVTRTEEHITEEALRNSSAKLMPPGTILVAMYGATVGAIAKLGIEASTNQAVCCIQPGKRLNGTYLKAFLHSQTVRLLSQRVGGAQPNLSQDLIRSLEVLLPPLELQIGFAERIEAILRAKAAHQSALAELDALFASLQNRAFAGGLS